MTKANFLPQSYLVQQQRARAQRRHFFLSAVALAAAAVACWSATRGLGGLERDAAALRAELDDARQRREALLAGTPEKVRLLKEMESRRRLIAPVSPAEVMGVVAAAMPKFVGLTSMTIITPPPPAPEASRSADNPGAAAGPKKPKGDNGEAYGAIRIELTGLAPSDVEAARLVRSLVDQRIFEDVHMTYARPIENAAWDTREFHIEADVPLGRRFVAAQPNLEACRAP